MSSLCYFVYDSDSRRTPAEKKILTIFKRAKNRAERSYSRLGNGVGAPVSKSLLQFERGRVAKEGGDFGMQNFPQIPRAAFVAFSTTLALAFALHLEDVASAILVLQMLSGPEASGRVD